MTAETQLRETCPRCHGVGNYHRDSSKCLLCGGTGRITRGTHSPDSGIPSTGDASEPIGQLGDFEVHPVGTGAELERLRKVVGGCKSLREPDLDEIRDLARTGRQFVRSWVQALWAVASRLEHVPREDRNAWRQLDAAALRKVAEQLEALAVKVPPPTVREVR